VKNDKNSQFKWQGDLYTMFYELALKNLLKEHGVFSFITPRFFLFNKDNFEMRKYLLENVNIVSMIECRPFESVVTENVISIIKKEKSSSNAIPFFTFFDFKFTFLNNYNKKWASTNKFL
jgi:hypothetical protein